MLLDSHQARFLRRITVKRTDQRLRGDVLDLLIQLLVSHSHPSTDPKEGFPSNSVAQLPQDCRTKLSP